MGEAPDGWAEDGRHDLRNDNVTRSYGKTSQRVDASIAVLTANPDGSAPVGVSTKHEGVRLARDITHTVNFTV